MKNKLHRSFIALALLALLSLNSQLSTARAQGTEFSYQGRLNTNGVPADGFFDFEFSLFTNSAGTGTQVGSTITHTNIGVTNGLFTASLDFGAVFTGNDTWLAINVRSNGVPPYTPLTPLQELLPTPYAVFADTASNLSGTLPAGQLTGTLLNGQLAHSSITVTAGTGLAGGGPVSLGGSTTLANAGVLSVTGNADITASTVAGAVTLGDTATSAATPNLIVKRDGAGSFSAGSATLSGTLFLPSPATIDSAGNPLLYADNSLNFFAGLNAGDIATSGIWNTATGSTSLQNNTTGDYNTATGAEALQANTNGTLNTATGVQALWINTSGVWNTANGVDALVFNTNGNYNTADGVNALSANTSGSFNTADGVYALSGNTAGSNNVALGYLAGQSITGSSNIDIGNPGLSSDNMVMRLGSGQTQTYIAGVINGNGGGLSNLNALEISGIVPLAELPPTVGLLSDAGTENFFAGQDAGNNTLAGAANTGVGDFALEFDSTGAYNTATGVLALYDNGVGSFNTADGAFALEYNSTGSNNTGTGVYALSAAFTGPDLTGSGNTADGGYALADNDSGYNNTGVGFQALQDDTSGFDNVAMGVNALQLLNSGSLNYANTAIGTYSCQNMTSGNDNAVVGYYSFPSLISGSDNSAVGDYSLYLLTNGTLNLALGLEAGFYLVNGSDNIYLGSYGAASDNNVTRIGAGQTDTYISSWNGAFDNGVLSLEQSDTNNGLVYQSSAGSPFYNVGNGPFLYGYDGGALGTVFPNEVSLAWDFTGSVWVSNNCSTKTLTIRGGSDLAEPFNISSDNKELPDGSVVVIDDVNPGRLKVSSLPYDTRVAGILSGANGIHPGIQMHQEGVMEGGRDVALSGRVYVQAEASNGPIKPGDLLTTSSTPGRAMKVTDHVRAQGAILGKAMTGLSEGNGMVLVLVTLQ